MGSKAQASPGSLHQTLCLLLSAWQVSLYKYRLTVDALNVLTEPVMKWLMAGTFGCARAGLWGWAGVSVQPALHRLPACCLPEPLWVLPTRHQEGRWGARLWVLGTL